jgi:DNA polymerase III delta prime subunit
MVMLAEQEAYEPAEGEIVYEPLGEMAQLFHWVNDGVCPHGEVVEVLVEGPTGTGKSRTVGELALQVMERWPGARILVVRKTRRSLTESWLVTFEEKVLWPGHPLLGGARRDNRHAYYHPNGATLVLGGMDEPANLFSTEWDVVIYEEAFQSVLDEWEKFFRSLRNFKMPFQLLIGVTNPSRARHYLNRRCFPGENGQPPKCIRIRTRHADNPSLRPSYLLKQSQMTGVRLRRLYLGEWCEADGAILPEYDSAKHGMFLKDMPYHKAIAGERVGMATRIKAFYGAMDWGYAGAGVLTVWAHDDLNRLFLVGEIYKSRHGIPYWADSVVKLDKRFRFDAIFCDPSRPEMIELFNISIGSWRGRDGQAVAIKAKNDWVAGIEAFRERLIGQNGEPTIFFGHDSLIDGRDELLADENLPFCLTMEIEEYVYKLAKEGEAPKSRDRDKESPACEAHAIDTGRYVCLTLAGMDERALPKKPTYEPGTYGSIDGSDELFGFDNPYRNAG